MDANGPPPPPKKELALQSIVRENRGVAMTRDQIAAEPYRFFFPAAVLAGLIGVLLWPLHLKGLVSWYPGASHAHLMAFGLFGGFMIGFLGTALPRMLAVRPLRFWELAALLLTFGVMVALFAAGYITAGDFLVLLFLCAFIAALGVRASKRKDLPPPGFVLVLLAFFCAITGALLSIVQAYHELTLFWITLQHLLSYQGFILLPILGVGGFLLPRFFGLPTTHDFPESAVPTLGWTRKAAGAVAAGAIIVGSFVLEAAGWIRLGPALRSIATLVYLLREIPVFQRAKQTNALASSLKIAFALLLSGFIAIIFFPAYRLSFLHLTLIGGFAVITFTVATRVVFGHSGGQSLLNRRNRWFLIAIGLMLFGMATRISGDFWPKIMASHYIYGALIWSVGVLLWAIYVLPKVLQTEPEQPRG